jgi:hypothetical protein
MAKMKAIGIACAQKHSPKCQVRQSGKHSVESPTKQRKSSSWKYPKAPVLKEMVWNGGERLCLGLKNQRVVDRLESTFWYASAHRLKATLCLEQAKPKSS